MSINKTTPTPWKVIVSSQGRHRLVGQDGRMIAQLWNTAARDHNARVLANAMDMFVALSYMAAQHRCGCGHPACNRCEDDRENAEILARVTGEPVL